MAESIFIFEGIFARREMPENRIFRPNRQARRMRIDLQTTKGIKRTNEDTSKEGGPE
jgi:hypothetical protein